MVVAALHILSSDSISDDDFHIADTLLQGFTENFQSCMVKREG